MDPHSEREMYVGATLVEKLRKLKDEEVLFGHVTIFGQWTNVTFIRVHYVDRDGNVADEGEQCPVHDPQCRWDALTEAEPEGVFGTVEVPGFEGEYVFFISPQME